MGIWKYFKSGSSASADDVASTLWNADVTPATYVAEEKYRAAILDQYKLYVEMADRVSARRGLANTFFLTLNTIAFTLIGVFWKDRPTADAWLLVIPGAILLTQCLAWFWIIRSYRQLNSGKWAVVGALETRLPASPYWKAEWKALGEGSDPARYWPLTHVEQWVPAIFAAAYLCGLVAALVA